MSGKLTKKRSIKDLLKKSNARTAVANPVSSAGPPRAKITALVSQLLEVQQQQTRAESPNTGDEEANLAYLIVDELNEVRQRPKEYARRLMALRPYYKDKLFIVNGIQTLTKEGIMALEECISFLMGVDPLPPLEICSGLTRSAEVHAVDLGISGLTGHTGSNGGTLGVRLGSVGTLAGAGAENVSYGGTRAEEHIRQLLVDDGVRHRPHRENVLSLQHRKVGVAVIRHRRYGTVCVQCFASAFEPFPPENQPPRPNPRAICSTAEDSEIRGPLPPLPPPPETQAPVEAPQTPQLQAQPQPTPQPVNQPQAAPPQVTQVPQQADTPMQPQSNSDVNKMLTTAPLAASSNPSNANNHNYSSNNPQLNQPQLYQSPYPSQQPVNQSAPNEQPYPQQQQNPAIQPQQPHHNHPQSGSIPTAGHQPTQPNVIVSNNNTPTPAPTAGGSEVGSGARAPSAPPSTPALDAVARSTPMHMRTAAALAVAAAVRMRLVARGHGHGADPLGNEPAEVRRHQIVSTFSQLRAAEWVGRLSVHVDELAAREALERALLTSRESALRLTAVHNVEGAVARLRLLRSTWESRENTEAAETGAREVLLRDCVLGGEIVDRMALRKEWDQQNAALAVTKMLQAEMSSRVKTEKEEAPSPPQTHQQPVAASHTPQHHGRPMADPPMIIVTSATDTTDEMLRRARVAADRPLGCVTFSGLRAVGLLAADKKAFGKDSSDPYVKITCSSQTAQTKHIDNNLNPAWNEEFRLEGCRPDDIATLQVFDRDAIGSDDPLGECQLQLPWGNITDMPIEIPLYNVKGQKTKAQGKLQVTLSALFPNLQPQGAQAQPPLASLTSTLAPPPPPPLVQQEFEPQSQPQVQPQKISPPPSPPSLPVRPAVATPPSPAPQPSPQQVPSVPSREPTPLPPQTQPSREQSLEKTNQSISPAHSYQAEEYFPILPSPNPVPAPQAVASYPPAGWSGGGGREQEARVGGTGGAPLASPHQQQAGHYGKSSPSPKRSTRRPSRGALSPSRRTSSGTVQLRAEVRKMLSKLEELENDVGELQRERRDRQRNSRPSSRHSSPGWGGGKTSGSGGRGGQDADWDDGSTGHTHNDNLPNHPLPVPIALARKGVLKSQPQQSMVVVRDERESESPTMWVERKRERNVKDAQVGTEVDVIGIVDDMRGYAHQLVNDLDAVRQHLEMRGDASLLSPSGWRLPWFRVPVLAQSLERDELSERSNIARREAEARAGADMMMRAHHSLLRATGRSGSGYHNSAPRGGVYDDHDYGSPQSSWGGSPNDARTTPKYESIYTSRNGVHGKVHTDSLNGSGWQRISGEGFGDHRGHREPVGPPAGNVQPSAVGGPGGRVSSAHSPHLSSQHVSPAASLFDPGTRDAGYRTKIPDQIYKDELNARIRQQPSSSFGVSRRVEGDGGTGGVWNPLVWSQVGARGSETALPSQSKYSNGGTAYHTSVGSAVYGASQPQHSPRGDSHASPRHSAMDLSPISAYDSGFRHASVHDAYDDFVPSPRISSQSPRTAGGGVGRGGAPWSTPTAHGGGYGPQTSEWRPRPEVITPSVGSTVGSSSPTHSTRESHTTYISVRVGGGSRW